MDVCCKKCDWTGQVFVGYKNRPVKKKVGRRRGIDQKAGTLFAKRVGTRTKWKIERVPTEDTVGIPATSIPCPQCGEHQLERITRCIRRKTSKPKNN